MKWTLILFFVPLSLFSQAPDDGLVFYADVMRHAEVPEHREWGADNFKQELNKVLTSDGLSKKQLNKLRSWISFLTPSDSAFTIISWQVNGSDTVFYEGVIQLRSGKTVPLVPKSYDVAESAYDTYDPENWLAVHYYDVVRFAENQYLLLGYNSSNPVMNMKIAETLTVSDENIQFGHEWFQMDGDPVRPHMKNRIVLQYDKRSSARMAYDLETKTLFYDHVIPMETMEKKDEISWVPDGSYEGFRLEGNKWMYVEKLFNRQVDVPPGVGKPQTVKKDILGRPIQK